MALKNRGGRKQANGIGREQGGLAWLHATDWRGKILEDFSPAWREMLSMNGRGSGSRSRCAACSFFFVRGILGGSQARPALPKLHICSPGSRAQVVGAECRTWEAASVVWRSSRGQHPGKCYNPSRPTGATNCTAPRHDLLCQVARAPDLGNKVGPGSGIGPASAPNNKKYTSNDEAGQPLSGTAVGQLQTKQNMTPSFSTLGPSRALTDAIGIWK